MTRNKIAIAALSVFCVLLAFILVPKPNHINHFVIEPGSGARAITGKLSYEHVIWSKYPFLLYVGLTHSHGHLQAGDYDIPPSVSIWHLVRIFTSGKTRDVGVSVTIPEGSDVAGVDHILSILHLVGGGQFLHKALQLEGFLFPDTYYIDPKTSIESIIDRLQANFKSKTQNLFSGMSTDDIKKTVIIASILEKEVKTDNDMRLVSGIIQRRLSLGMPLQIDATVLYGQCLRYYVKGSQCNQQSINVTKALSEESLYNTYRHSGLPPGPISNPGLVALYAALHPTKSDFLYYLTTRQGKAIFSRNFEEHQKARLKYL